MISVRFLMLVQRLTEVYIRNHSRRILFFRRSRSILILTHIGMPVKDPAVGDGERI